MRKWKLGGSGIFVTPKTAPREAGRLGGHARAKALGKEGMRELARRGGVASAAKGKEHLSDLGKRGQKARSANLRRAVLQEVEAHVLSKVSDGDFLLWLRAEIAKTEKPTE